MGSLVERRGVLGFGSLHARRGIGRGNSGVWGCERGSLVGIREMGVAYINGRVYKHRSVEK